MRSPGSAHPRTSSSLRLASAALTLGLCLFALGACNATSHDPGFDSGSTWGGIGDGAGNGSGGGDTMGSGAASSGSGGVIDITPPSTSVGGSSAPYAALCGGGECSPGEAGDGCAELEGGAGGSEGVEPVTLSCAVSSSGGTVASLCLPDGASQVHEPCTSAADCGQSLGCVQIGGRGQCEPYCCGDVEACPSQTLCSPLPMAESPDADIPVCVPTRACQLLEDKSCCVGDDCSAACAVVRDDGTTSCVIPGEGTLDEPCPCAAGYTCSKLTNECKQLCHTNTDTSECEDGGKCQGGSGGLPPGIGICVAGTGSKYAE